MGFKIVAGRNGGGQLDSSNGLSPDPGLAGLVGQNGSAYNRSAENGVWPLDGRDVRIRRVAQLHHAGAAGGKGNAHDDGL